MPTDTLHASLLDAIIVSISNFCYCTWRSMELLGAFRQYKVYALAFYESAMPGWLLQPHPRCIISPHSAKDVRTSINDWPSEASPILSMRRWYTGWRRCIQKTVWLFNDRCTCDTVCWWHFPHMSEILTLPIWILKRKIKPWLATNSFTRNLVLHSYALLSSEHNGIWRGLLVPTYYLRVVHCLLSYN